jgi:hypothetical protein
LWKAVHVYVAPGTSATTGDHDDRVIDSDRASAAAATSLTFTEGTRVVATRTDIESRGRGGDRT